MLTVLPNLTYFAQPEEHEAPRWCQRLHARGSKCNTSQKGGERTEERQRFLQFSICTSLLFILHFLGGGGHMAIGRPNGGNPTTASGRKIIIPPPAAWEVFLLFKFVHVRTCVFDGLWCAFLSLVLKSYNGIKPYRHDQGSKS